MDQSSPLVGVCIVSWNSFTVIGSCLDALLDSQGVQLCVVLVDNGSGDGTVKVVTEGFPSVLPIQNDENIGFARANNIGAAHLMAAGCEFLVFLNPDTRVHPSAIAHLVQTLAEPKVGCAGGLDLDHPSHAFRNRPTFLQKLILYGLLRRTPLIRVLLRSLVVRLARAHYIDSVSTGESVYAASGALLAMRRTVFQMISGFDERTFLYEEEFILSERLRLHDLNFIAAPNATYNHVGGHSTGSVLLRTKRAFIQSEYHLVRAYYHWSQFGASALWIFRVWEWALFALCRRASELSKRQVR
jgi:N-acetylglucosaminyl-diphospho-decaprenol L-rhamnosyltransferase